MEEKIVYLRDLLASRNLDPSDYNEMKAGYTNQLEKLEAKLSTVDGDRKFSNHYLKRA